MGACFVVPSKHSESELGDELQKHAQPRLDISGLILPQKCTTVWHSRVLLDTKRQKAKGSHKVSSWGVEDGGCGRPAKPKASSHSGQEPPQSMRLPLHLNHAPETPPLLTSRYREDSSNSKIQNV